MMKTVAALALLGSAAAFAPCQEGRTSTAVAANEDQETFDRLRTTELKHGRVAMLAVTGYLTTAAGFRFPGFPADVPAGFKAWGALASTPDGMNVLGQTA